MKSSTKINSMVASVREKRSPQQAMQRGLDNKFKQFQDEKWNEKGSLDSSTKLEGMSGELQSRLSQMHSQESNRNQNVNKIEEHSSLKTVKSPSKNIGQFSQRASNPSSNNFLKRQLLGRQPDVVSPRLTSPKVQTDIIQYLKKQNQKLLEENKRKDQLITKLLESTTSNKQLSKNQSNKLLYPSNPPRTVETQVNTEITRLPQIKTPQPKMKHRFDTQNNEQFEFQVPHIYHKPKQEIQINAQNWSFGKKAEDEELFNNTFQQNKSQINKYFEQQQNRQQINNMNKVSQLKSNFTKPLLKLPQEFHNSAWNSKHL